MVRQPLGRSRGGGNRERNRRNSRIEPLPAKFFHGGSCAIICSTHRQQIQYAASHRAHGFPFSVILSRSTRSLLLPPFRSTPAFLPLSGKCTDVRSRTLDTHQQLVLLCYFTQRGPCFARVQPLRFVVGFEECAVKIVHARRGLYITVGDIKLKDFYENAFALKG